MSWDRCGILFAGKARVSNHPTLKETIMAAAAPNTQLDPAQTAALSSLTAIDDAAITVQTAIQGATVQTSSVLSALQAGQDAANKLRAP
jgi:hypothetical protein